ncbi:hypothetical protein KGM_203634 [Danaus plexippus plexippus]|uniref:Uncharacterized protein n=1 Tax=Danaus plexippus plexippus TaxID=278856 RepID=A0A212EPK4_DANPL|nr:hypothetical protein KGM_203634 [Danaus plexippus plexippus]
MYIQTPRTRNRPGPGPGRAQAPLRYQITKGFGERHEHSDAITGVRQFNANPILSLLASLEQKYERMLLEDERPEARGRGRSPGPARDTETPNAETGSDRRRAAQGGRRHHTHDTGALHRTYRASSART